MTERTIQILSEQMESLLETISFEYQKCLVNLSGSLKDIECGTLIKIPIPVGFVKLYKYADTLKLSCWIEDEVTQSLTKKQAKASKTEIDLKSTQL